MCHIFVRRLDGDCTPKSALNLAVVEAHLPKNALKHPQRVLFTGVDASHT
ncbi:hypothetical protein [Listeria booriae]|nr:hypothetical protein [Listeria booriae]MBC2023294.1 hypothetical protein [Listeria booriae]